MSNGDQDYRVGSIVFNPAPDAAPPFTTVNTQTVMLSYGGRSPQQMADRIAELESEVEALRKAFNVRQWSREMSDAWHKAIPDTNKAFVDLLDAALKEQSKC